MRLICPNCDAQYEVDDNAIPESGRDVQCSNCGHAWFQMSPEAELALLAEEEVFDGDVGAVVPEPAPTPAPAPAAPPPPASAPADPAPEAPPPVAAEAAPRRSMDENLVAVLREEAEREAAQRRSEAPRPVETQTDLGLEEPSGAAAAARRRVAQMKGADPEPAPAPAKPATRRDLLPDIEEINSTLRASNEPRPEGTPVPPPPSRAAFRSGFVLMMVIAVAMVLAYVMAPRIAEQIPGSASALSAYVGSVDQARLWLDQQMQSAIEALNGAGG